MITTRLTRHTVIATLMEYIVSERSAALKRKMFGMSDGGDLGQILNFQVQQVSETKKNMWGNCRIVVPS